jgi:hypothetical protein
MSENTDKEPQPKQFLDRWTNDEVAIEIPSGPSLPLRPITGKRLESLKAERALRARLDPAYRAHLESCGIYLTPEELGETKPPASGTAEETTS